MSSKNKLDNKVIFLIIFLTVFLSWIGLAVLALFVSGVDAMAGVLVAPFIMFLLINLMITLSGM